MSPVVTYVTFAGLLVTIGLLSAAMLRPAQTPVHRVPWVIALVFIGISIGVRLVILVGVAFNGSITDVLPILIGNLAVLLVFIAAFRQPAWAGWVLIGTAITLPLLTWGGSAIAGERDPLEVAAPMAGFYGIPALITGGMLVVSGWAWKSTQITNA